MQSWDIREKKGGTWDKEAVTRRKGKRAHEKGAHVSLSGLDCDFQSCDPCLLDGVAGRELKELPREEKN